MLNLFIVVYLKCSKAVQLSFLDDLDKITKMIKDDFKNQFVQKKFCYSILFANMHQFKQCYNTASKAQKFVVCDIMNLENIKMRTKRYDPRLPHTSSKSSVQLTHPGCNIHGNIVLKDAIKELKQPRTFISFISFLIQVKFKLLNTEDFNIQEKSR